MTVIEGGGVGMILRKATILKEGTKETKAVTGMTVTSVQRRKTGKTRRMIVMSAMTVVTIAMIVMIATIVEKTAKTTMETMIDAGMIPMMIAGMIKKEDDMHSSIPEPRNH
mmetsp:Transcript_10210/g.19608  ORF Transcript_10210/g.19608 Transcript_10210/m.19608 type:complete len:111 (-) Transcript_10210:139-471(-)